MSKTNVAGYVAGFAIPEVVQGINAFALGLRSVNPKAVVKVLWLGTWFDPTRERDAAMTLFNQDVDVIAFHTVSSAIMAAAQERGKLAIAYHSDMQALDAVDVILGSHFAPRAIESRIRRKKDPRLELEDIGQAVLVDLRHRCERVFLQLDRARQIVVAQHWIEHVFQQGQAVHVGGDGRVEPGLAAAEHHLQRLLRLGCRCGGERSRAQQGRQRQQACGAGPSTKMADLQSGSIRWYCCVCHGRVHGARINEDGPG